MTDDERTRVKELLEAGASNTTVVDTIKKEFGTDVSRVNINTNYRNKSKPDLGLDIENQDWFKNAEKLKSVEGNMLTLVDEGYKKLLDYVNNVIIDNPKDAIAVVQAIKQAQSVWDRLIVPTRSKEKRRSLTKEILE
jgi:hypothetical protein